MSRLRPLSPTLALILLLFPLFLPPCSTFTPPNPPKPYLSILNTKITAQKHQLKTHGTQKDPFSGGGGGITFPPRGGGGEGSGGEGGDGDDGKLLTAAVHAYRRYQGMLASRPLVTKSVSAGLITLFGDLLAQALESRIEGYKRWNLVRMAAFTVSGGLFVGPFVHYWYEVLWEVGRRLPKSTSGAVKTVLQVRGGRGEEKG